MPRQDAMRNRETVVEAGMKLLGEDPTASMQEVADRSGLGRSTVYRHFPNREALITAMYFHAVADSWRLAEEIFARDLPVEESLRELCDMIVMVGVRNRFLLGHLASASNEMRETRTAPESPIRSYLADCQKRGEIRDDMTLDWIMNVYQTLSLSAMREVAIARHDEDETKRMLGDTIVSFLRPER
ncbi:MAG: TetR/AcrR family transcriptional regulator [Solirubrobacterales bacterium]|nr:TetR/AcrR family transcriptional regulator [Solirubrobacterales bacterium]MCB8970539.1 TetR/AcrR family transcriptional regulator [Thermoleophilales bacterium]MCO5325699.1 TetR/AcrR family transcriptional regulator [Solirubrobacterales bacterium]